MTEILGKHDSAVVYAGARDPEKAVALHELKARYQERITIVRLISGDVEGNAAIAQEIEARHGRMDTVIANAGMYCHSIGPAQLQAHLRCSHGDGVCTSL